MVPVELGKTICLIRQKDGKNLQGGPCLAWHVTFTQQPSQCHLSGPEWPLNCVCVSSIGIGLWVFHYVYFWFPAWVLPKNSTKSNCSRVISTLLMLLFQLSKTYGYQQIFYWTYWSSGFFNSTDLDYNRVNNHMICVCEYFGLNHLNLSIHVFSIFWRLGNISHAPKPLLQDLTLVEVPFFGTSPENILNIKQQSF